MTPAQSRLLVIDDDPGTLVTYGMILRLAGYDVATASTGGDGLRFVRSEKENLRLVLTDLRLPDLSGLEVLAAVRESAPHVPVVMISAWGTTASEAAAKQLGAVEFIEKPIVGDDLVDVVERNLRRGDRPTAMAVEKPPLGHAAMRWATIVVPLTRLTADVPTLAEWGKQVATSPSTVKTWCTAAGVHAGDALDFVRGLRILIQHEGYPCDWYNVLAIVDARTLARFLDRGRLPRAGVLPRVGAFLSGQQFITNPALVSAVKVLLELSD